MVETLLPADPGISETERQRIAADVSAVIKVRVGGLPVMFRMGVRFLVWIFEILALVFLFGPFNRADREKRKKFLNRAEEWQALHLDDLVKLVRSLALLVYYADETVRRQIGFTP